MWGETTRVENRGETTRGKRPGGNVLGAKRLVTPQVILNGLNSGVAQAHTVTANKADTLQLVLSGPECYLTPHICECYTKKILFLNQTV